VGQVCVCVCVPRNVSKSGRDNIDPEKKEWGHVTPVPPANYAYKAKEARGK